MRIEHIDDVLPHVSGRSDFVVAERPGYTVIDYVYAAADTFDHPARMECRGIKFGPDGKILARPFAKFFNIGEKEHTQQHLIDMAQNHTIMEKIDGSMIHPAIVDGELVFMTRMGRTDVARKAEGLLTPVLERACREALLGMGVTPIFEFTAPDNRIIIKYEQPALHLLALRETVSGNYLPFETIRPNAIRMGIAPVPFVPSVWSTTQDFVSYARAIQGAEGFVVRFDNGLWVKMKGDDYVLKHKSKDQISLEKNALAVILSGSVDDVLPLLSAEDRHGFEAYRNAVLAGIAETAATVSEIVGRGAHLDQKHFAVDHLAQYDGMIKAIAFLVRRGVPAMDAVRSAVSKRLGSQTDVDGVRPLFKAEWSF